MEMHTTYLQLWFLLFLSEPRLRSLAAPQSEAPLQKTNTLGQGPRSNERKNVVYFSINVFNTNPIISSKQCKYNVTFKHDKKMIRLLLGNNMYVFFNRRYSLCDVSLLELKLLGWPSSGCSERPTWAGGSSPCTVRWSSSGSSFSLAALLLVISTRWVLGAAGSGSLGSPGAADGSSTVEEEDSYRENKC